MRDETKNRLAEHEKYFEAPGAKKVGHPIAAKGDKEIDLNSVGGVRVRRSPLWDTKPTKATD